MRSLVILFFFLGSAYGQESIIYPNDAVNARSLGNHIASTNDYIAASATSSLSNERVYIFRENGSTWIQEAILSVSDSTDRVLFGTSLAAYDNHILVGACAEYENGVESGAAYIFERKNNEWQQKARLIPSTLQDNQCFGNNVVIYKNFALVSADEEINGNRVSE